MRAVVTSAAWSELKAVSAREGLVAAPYERRHGEHSRVVQAVKLYLFGASSGGCKPRKGLGSEPGWGEALGARG